MVNNDDSYVSDDSEITNDDSSQTSTMNVLRHTTFDNVTNQLRKREVQSHFGVPTCMRRSKSDQYLLVGTSLGMVLVHELDPISRQLTLKSILTQKDQVARGSITSIDTTFNGELTIVGYDSGKITAWQTNKDTILKSFDDLFEFPIQHVGITSSCQSTGSIARIVASDTKGHIKIFDLNKSLFRYSYEVEYEVEFKRERIIDSKILTSVRPGVSLLAFITQKRIFLFDIFVRTPALLSPEPIIVFKSSQDVTTECLSVSWCKPTGKDMEGSSLVAVLYRMYIVIYRVASSSPSSVSEVQRICVDRETCVIDWASSTMIVAMAENGTVSLIDISNETPMIETTKLRSSVYCVSSGIECMMNDIILLDFQPAGPCISRVTILGWKQRITLCLEAGKWKEGVQLGLSLYTGNALSHVATNEKTKRHLASTLETLIRKKVDEIGKGSADPTMIEFCMKSCIRLRRDDFVYTYIYNTVQESRLLLGEYFSCLESLILEGSVEEVPQGILLKFLEKLPRVSHKIRSIDNAMAKLNIKDVDFETMKSVCCRPGFELYRTLCHIYNDFHKEYLQPLIELYSRIVLTRSPDSRVIDVLIEILEMYSLGKIKDASYCADAKKDVLDFFFFSRVWNPKDPLSQQLIELKKDECFAQLARLRPNDVFRVFMNTLCDEEKTSPWDDYNKQEVLDLAHKTIKDSKSTSLKVAFYEFYCSLLVTDRITQISADEFMEMFQIIAQDICDNEKQRENRQHALIRTLEFRNKKGMLSSGLIPLMSVVRANKLYVIARYLFLKTKKWKWYVDMNYERMTNKEGEVTEVEKMELKKIIQQLTYEIRNEEAAHTYIIDEVNRDIEKAKKRKKEAQFQRLRYILSMYVEQAYKICRTEKTALTSAYELLMQESFDMLQTLHQSKKKGFRPRLMVLEPFAPEYRVGPCSIDRVDQVAMKNKVDICLLEQDRWDEELDTLPRKRKTKRNSAAASRRTVVLSKPPVWSRRPISEPTEQITKHTVIDIMDFDEIVDSLI